MRSAKYLGSTSRLRNMLSASTHRNCSNNLSDLASTNNLGKAKLYDPVTINRTFKNQQEYDELYNASVNNPSQFWDQYAQENVHWFAPYTEVFAGEFSQGNIAWFLNGKLNVSYNCVDRHAEKNPDKIAIIYEGDEPGDIQRITFKQLLGRVCQYANMLKSHKVKKHDIVCIYMPMIPEAVVAMLACARIGAAHSVVFAGFSSQALQSRIQDSSSTVLITSNESIRGKKVIPLKKYCDEALIDCPTVRSVFVKKHTQTEVPMKEGRDYDLDVESNRFRPYCPPVWMDSEDMLFMLYTSGSTGKPKGLVHTTGGYLVNANATFRYIFDHQEDDVYACVADVGWITGHSYVVYGPLSNGASTFLFDSVPLYPNASRYWDLIQRHKITQFYTAPTALRALMAVGPEFTKGFDLSTLRVLGSVGEPINKEAWEWYYNVIGGGKCDIVDTWWQTETGGILMTPIPGMAPIKPGACSHPFFGIQPALLNPTSGEEITDCDTKGVLGFRSPWPGIARSIFNDHSRYVETYFKPYPGFYFSGDGAMRDEDGHYWIYGRVDDVISVSGHRIGTAEIEAALQTIKECSEAAVVAIPHSIKGQAIFCYCVSEKEGDVEFINILKNAVRQHVGPLATPEKVVIVPGLPKTRSGKIMRRILRKIACGEADLGDISTLLDPQIVEKIIAVVEKK